MDNFISFEDLEKAISGEGAVLNTQYVNELKEKYGQEPIAFWHMRRFDTLCDYIQTTVIQNENVLSNDAKERLIDFFITFVKNHSNDGIL